MGLGHGEPGRANVLFGCLPNSAAKVERSMRAGCQPEQEFRFEFDFDFGYLRE